MNRNDLIVCSANENGVDADLLKGKIYEKGYTQSTLSEALHISGATLSSLMKHRRTPSYDVMRALQLALNMSAEEAGKVFFSLLLS